ncbi:hypothetical protein [Streptomyces finlayi]|nr:hypothetical protein [Streptomyces finlayi]
MASALTKVSGDIARIPTEDALLATAASLAVTRPSSTPANGASTSPRTS